MQFKINEQQNTQIEINEKQNTKAEVKEEQDAMEFLKAQEKIIVIDIPDKVAKEKEAEEVEKAKEEERLKHIIFNQFKYKRVYSTAIIAYVLSVVCKLVYGVIDNAIFGEEVKTNTNQAMIEDDLKNLGFFNILNICIIAPFLEEFIFRSFIFKVINWSGKKIQKKVEFLGIIIRILAFIISSAIFAFGHYGFSFELLKDEIRSFPTYFISGLCLAYAYNRDGYLLASVLAHMLNNVVAVLLICFIVNDDFGTIAFSLIKGIFNNIYF